MKLTARQSTLIPYTTLFRSHRVLVIDRPGYGYSDRTRGRSWTPAEQARLLFRAAVALGFDRSLACSAGVRSEEHTSELQSQSNFVCRRLLEKKKTWR